MAIKKRSAGRPQKEFSAEVGSLAEGMVLNGIPYAEIARRLHCSENTLKRYLGDTLHEAKARAVATVAGNLFQIATKGKGKEAVTASIFILKTQAGWKETQVTEIKSPADIPLNVLDMLEQQTRAELAAVIEQRQLPAPDAPPADGSTIGTDPTQAASQCSIEADEVIDIADLRDVSER